MKKMRTLLTMLLVVVMVVSMFAGCGSTANDKDEQGRTIISVGNWPNREGTSLDNYNKQKAKFELDNPDAVIEPDAWSFDRKTFYAKAAGGQLPTVYLAGFTEIPEIFDSEYSADITDALKKHGIYDSINPAIMDAISDDKGRVRAYPRSASVMGLMVNVDLMEQAGLMEVDGTPKQPETWDEVLEFAKKIKETTGKAGFLIPTSGNTGGWLFTALAWSFGADFIEKDEDGNWKATFNTPEAAAALQFIKDMKWKHDVLPGNSLIDETEWKKMFGIGNAGITFGTGDFPSRDLGPYGMNPNSVGMIAIPSGPKARVSLLAGEVLCVNNNATKDQIDAAIRWLKMAKNPELTEDIKITVASNIVRMTERNQIVGLKGMSIWKADAPSNEYTYEEHKKNTNINLNHIKLYDEFAANPTCEIRAEEPVCAQELYELLSRCIQEVLINENADCAKILEKANADFQANYLNNITY